MPATAVSEATIGSQAACPSCAASMRKAGATKWGMST